MRRFVALAVVLLVVLAAALLLRPDTRTEPALPDTSRDVTGARSGAMTAQSAPASRAQTESAPGRVAVVPAVPTAALARLSGRCVDATSEQPLAGCEVVLRGFRANTERMEKHGKPVEWKHPPKVLTGADGKFEISFDPPPPYQFTLDVKCIGHASLSGRWIEIASGKQMELGDVELPTGAQVDGRVLDAKGVPQAKLDVILERGGRGAFDGELGLLPRAYASARTMADGSFTFIDPLCAGTWSLRIGVGAVLDKPSSLEIKTGELQARLDVVVLAIDDLDVIEGTVLDDLEQPAHGVTIDSSQRGQGPQWSISTNREGRFRIVRKPNDPKDPIALSVSFAEGYESMRDERKIAWGTKDVVLHVNRALAVEVQALDDATGQPIEVYGVRCFRDPMSGGGWSSRDSELRARGKHAAGIAQVSGVRRGKNLLMVEPSERKQFAPLPPLAFEMGEKGAARQIVRLPRYATRILEIVRAGKPVVGTKIELLAAVGEWPIDLAVHALESHEIFQRGTMPQSLLVQSTQTDAAGRCELRGPVARVLAVRVLGPGHTPFVQSDVMLPGEVLQLRVAAGATIVGRVRPASVLAQFEPPVSGRMAGRGRSQAPGVLLRDPNDARHKIPARNLDWIPVQSDGTFEIQGVEPGDWDVYLGYWFFHGNGVASSGSAALAQIKGLRDGDTREITLDASALVHGELRGLLLIDGVPSTNAHVGLVGTRSDDKGGKVQLNAPQVMTDAEGRFAVKLQRGDWRVNMGAPSGGVPNRRTVQYLETATVRSAEVVDVVFHFERKVLSAVLLDADGKPCADREVQVMAGQIGAAERTDVDGKFTLDPVSTGRMEFFVWPPHLDSNDQRMLLAQQLEKQGKSWDAVNEQRIRLGEIEIRADQKRAEITLRLPQ